MADAPRYRVLALASHPVQYMSPILRRMAQRLDLDLSVAYCSLRGAEAGYDPEFGANVKWDTPLLDGYGWAQLANRGSGGEGFWGLNNPAVWGLIRHGNFDAVLCFTGYRCATFWMALLAAKISRTAFLFGTDAIGIAPRDGKRWKIWPKKLLWPVLFRLADQVIVPSSNSRDLMHSLGISESRVTLAPYCVDNDWWMTQAATVDRDAIRAKWGIPEAGSVILFCAKLQPWKRPLDLLQAFARASIANTYLVYAGEGPLRATLKREAERLEVTSRVRFLGFVNQSELPGVYRASDVMVLSSEYDAFGVVLNEAMCCGCAVIASDRVGAARDLIAPVSPELIYPCGDVDALAAALSFALSDRDRLAQLTTAAAERIRTWSPKENIEAMMEALRTAVRKIGRDPKTAQRGEAQSAGVSRGTAS